MDLRIQKLDDSYKGLQVDYSYTSQFYYDIQKTYNDESINFRLTKKHFSTPIEKRFQDKLLEDYLEKPTLFGAYIKEKLVGYLEVNHEKWNNRMRITNILVFDKYRREGIGTALMEKAIETSRNHGCRAIVLETQSCNYPAISFYKKMGFRIIGFDLEAYSNEDVEKLEYRLEMGMKI